MQNPWLDLPPEPPFVAPADARSLARLRRLADDRSALKLDLPPQPWTGNPNTAEVFMLVLNPGFSPDDYVEFGNADYAEQWRLALSFQTRTPFYFLDPAFSGTGGYRWWARRLRELIAEVGLEAVAQRVMCIEHFPYNSVSFKPLGRYPPQSALHVRRAPRGDEPRQADRGHATQASLARTSVRTALLSLHPLEQPPEPVSQSSADVGGAVGAVGGGPDGVTDRPALVPLAQNDGQSVSRNAFSWRLIWPDRTIPPPPAFTGVAADLTSGRTPLESRGIEL